MKSVGYIRHTVDVAWSILLRACQKDGRAWDFLEKAEAIAVKQEREHRAMGARFTHGQASYRVPAYYAARVRTTNCWIASEHASTMPHMLMAFGRCPNDR